MGLPFICWLAGLAVCKAVVLVDRIGFGVVGSLVSDCHSHALMVLSWATVGTAVGLGFGLARGMRLGDLIDAGRFFGIWVAAPFLCVLGMVGPSPDEYFSPPPVTRAPPHPAGGPPSATQVDRFPAASNCEAARARGSGDHLGKAERMLRSMGADSRVLADAANEARRAIQLDPWCAQAHAVLARALFWSAYVPCAGPTAYAEALRESRLAAASAPGPVAAAAAHVLTGQILAAQGNWKEAISTLQESLRLSPRDDQARDLVYSLSLLMFPQPTFLATVVKTVQHKPMAATEVEELNQPALETVRYVLQGRAMGQPPDVVRDWFLSCPDSPLRRAAGAAQATGSRAKRADRWNTHLVSALMRRRGAVTPERPAAAPARLGAK
jgi:hypothetical protein